MLTASGSQFKDWSAAYRLFKGSRMKLKDIFGVIRRQVVLLNESEDSYIYAHMDDTLLRKTGKKIHGSGWLRDPLGPPFANNFVWGQRFVQISLSLLQKDVYGPSRAIPVDFLHCPPVSRPSKNATEQELAVFKERQKKEKMSEVGIQRIIQLREDLKNDGYGHRKLILSVDGSYTNETVIRKLPPNVVLLGRIRKDAKLFALPSQERKPGSRGRIAYYGHEMPTPEQIRKDDTVPYQSIEVWAAGKTRELQVKAVRDIRWRKAGAKNLMLIVIKPIGYRVTKKSKLLYRNPAYLISTDQEMDLKCLVQAYIRRWEIEVGFRDQKSLMGCGQAQVREKDAVQKVPAFLSACYGMLLLASHRANQLNNDRLPSPKWYNKNVQTRTTTGDILNAVRLENWAMGSKINLTDFVNIENKLAKYGKMINSAFSSMIYMRK